MIAVKIIDKDGFHEAVLAQFQLELEISVKLKHPNIIQTYGYKETADQFFIFMEYCENGTLLKHLEE